MASKDSAPKINARPTVHDVAREAGVSIKTVSRVINGERHVRAVLQARVYDAIARLGYQPNEVARSLKGSRSRMIGLIIADISNPFYATCAKAAEQVAREHGLAVVLCASNEDTHTERAYIDLLVRRRVEGLLLVPAPGDHTHLFAAYHAGLPLVALDRPIPELDTDVVVVQNQAGARIATEHLLGHGHRRVACIGADDHVYTDHMRVAGYREALAVAGVEEITRFGATNIEAAIHATHELLQMADPPTAFFAINNLITVGILQALDRSGLVVPDDIALVGFDDFELASVLSPRLTLVRQPAAELGRQAALLLVERIQQRQDAAPHVIILDTELILRESCGCSLPPDTALAIRGTG